MKVRAIVAGCTLPFVIVIPLLLPKVVTAIIMGLLCAIGAYELINSTKLVKNNRMLWYSMAAAFLVTLWSYLGCSQAVALVIVLMFLSLLFVETMLKEMKISFSRLSVCIVAGLLIPYLLCSIVRILMMKDGVFYVLMPFAIAFSSDSFAYLTGVKLGKHKLAPTISPKKSIEGLIGGLLAAIVTMLLYGLVLQLFCHFRVNYLFAIVYAVVGTAFGVFGDLCFSVVTRQAGVKDYGNLIPGHGGVLDRFDSMVFVAPLVEAFLLLLPMAEKVG